MRNYKPIAIIVLAVFLRLNYDTFISGYNYDEIAMMSTAVQSFPFGILKTAAVNDYHAPLYQLIIHFLTYLTPQWVFIRLFNVILSVLNVFVFYKIGCLLKNKNAGYLTALILCVNHLAISTASFVKFYALAFLLLSFSVYYFIKIIKYNKGHKKLGIINALLILTSTYGFIFVFLEYFYLFFKKRDRALYRSIIISLTGFILYLPILLAQIKLNFTNIFSPHSYYVEFAPVSLYNALNDYFAPLLNYCCNLATVVSFSIFLHFIDSINNKTPQFHYLIEFIIFSVVPVTLAILFILKGIKKNIARDIGIVSISFLIIFIIMTRLELTGFVPIYIYPFFLISLILMGYGVLEFKNKKTALILFTIYILINLSITNVYPPDKREWAGAKIFYCYEEYYKTHDNNALIATVGGRFLKKYYKDKNIIDFDNEKIRGNFNREFISLVYGKDIAKKINKKNAHELITPLILKRYRNPEFEKYFTENVYNKLNKGDYLIFSFENEEEIPFIDEYSVYSKRLINKPYCYHLTKAAIKNGLSKEDDCIDTAAMTQAIESYSYEYLIELLEKYFKRVKFEQYSRTNNDKFVKNYEDNTNKYSTLYLASNTNKSWIFVTYQKQ